MFITLVTFILYTVQMLTPQCKCLNLVDLPNAEIVSFKPKVKGKPPYTTPIKVPVKYESYSLDVPKDLRRYWLVHDSAPNEKMPPMRPRVYEDEKDSNLKTKIAILVQQTMHDTERRLKHVNELKDKYREEAPYKAGFILNMIQKSKNVLDELFNVAVKHKEEWMAVEQLKIFELIVHTNVDATNLLRQLVDIHVKHMNATRTDNKKVLLI